MNTLQSPRRLLFGAFALLVVGGAIGFHLAGSNSSHPLLPSALAQSPQRAPSASPIKAIPDREMYYPGSEDLAPDEMRVIACGTGMPNARPKQAAACWLVELGNGDKFLFDIGTGSAERISALQIPYNYLNKVFIGHLHSDHFGDLDALYCGGIVANRVVPLEVWGPNSIEPRYGTRAAMDAFEKMLAWDIDTRMGNTDTRGAFLKVTEFPYDAVNNVIYESNGVTIRTIPAIHIFDGAVSFILEWNGLKLCYSSDTFPNKWWLEHAKDADISVHECFIAPESLVEKQGFTPEAALNVGTQIHTSPAQFGKVMAETNPRLAVGYHFFNDFDTAPAVLRDVRRTYDGPLALALDYMVFNVTKDEIKVRMAAVEEAVWPQPSTIPLVPPDPSLRRTALSKMMLEGRVVHRDVLQEVYDEINERFGSNEKVPEQHEGARGVRRYDKRECAGRGCGGGATGVDTMLKLLEPMSAFLVVMGLLGAGAAQAADDSITADAGVDYRAEVAGPEIVELLRQAPASAPLLGMLQEDGAPFDEASKLSRFREGPIDEWVVDIQPYIWLPAKVSLDSTVAGVTVPIEMDLGDIFSNFGVFAISGRLEAYHGSWGLMSDGLYVRLRSKSDNLPAQLSSVNVDQANVDLALAWRAFAIPIGDGGMRFRGTLFGGARFWYLKQEITTSVFAPIPPITLGGSERWVEPMIQGRLSLDVTDWLTLAFRADASGFGVGSATDLTWNVMAGGAINFGEGFSVYLGYRYFNVDYDAKAPAFGLNGEIHGPYIGFSFKF